MSILETAQELIHGDRNVSYGHPRENFKAIKDQWQAYLDNIGDRKLVELDVANMMILMKTARVVNGVYHQDSYTDIAGYAGTAERLQEPTSSSWFEDGRQFWANFNDIPAGVRVNSADEPDDLEPWVGNPGGWEQEGDYGNGPWREHLVEDFAPTPRTWHSLLDVPVGVEVRDADGDLWKRTARGAKMWRDRERGKWNQVQFESMLSENDHYAPFTEVTA